MKTKHNFPTRSKSARQNGKAANDSNLRRKYEATVFWRHTETISVPILARSLAEASRRAFELRADDLPEHTRDNLEGEIYIDGVRLVEGGQDND